MKVTFVRPPRHLWPFNSERSAFWQPLAFAALAAYLRRSLPGLDIRIIDCPILKMGWRTLESVLRESPPDVLCIGEETVSSDEGLRVARLSKSIHPECTVIAGGCHYPWAPEHAFSANAVDYVVCSEGEETLTELIRALLRGDDPSALRGIIRRSGSGWTCTPPRALIDDLDSLPMPAYDLLPMHLYGRHSTNHPRLAAVEHGRGCTDSCRFCILWKQMGRVVRENGGQRIRPCYRTKSARRSAEEVTRLVKRWGRKTIAWVDGTWNADASWTAEFCDRLVAAGTKVQMLAWMRADAVLRDEASGTLARQVRAGLVQAMIGVERTSADEVRGLGKHGSPPEVTREAFRLLHRKYPSVYTIGSMIYGVPGETAQHMRRMVDALYDYRMDYSFLIPLTPNPGTDLWEDPETRRRIRRPDFRSFNFHTPVMDTERFRAEDLEKYYVRTGVDVSPRRLMWLVRSLFGSPARRRTVHRALCRHACEVVWRAMTRRIAGNGAAASTGLYAVRPEWYDT